MEVDGPTSYLSGRQHAAGARLCLRRSANPPAAQPRQANSVVSIAQGMNQESAHFVLLRHTCAIVTHMVETPFPTSQGELLRRARGERSQTAFAKLLGVDRTCLSRYETEALGAPTSVLNYCLRAVSGSAESAGNGDASIDNILLNARHLVAQLESVQRDRVLQAKSAPLTGAKTR